MVAAKSATEWTMQTLKAKVPHCYSEDSPAGSVCDENKIGVQASATKVMMTPFMHSEESLVLHSDSLNK